MEPCSPRRTASHQHRRRRAICRCCPPSPAARACSPSRHSFSQLSLSKTRRAPCAPWSQQREEDGRTHWSQKAQADGDWWSLKEHAWHNVSQDRWEMLSFYDFFSGPACILIYVLILCSQDKLLCITSLLRSSCMWLYVWHLALLFFAAAQSWELFV
jgi:hypothetical protein